MKAYLQTQKLLDEAIEQKNHKHDYTVSAASITFDDSARMILPNEEASLFNSVGIAPAPLDINDNAFTQMCWKMGKVILREFGEKSLPETYLRAISTDLRQTLLNDHAQQMGNEKWFVRAYDDFARAILSDRYGMFDNDEILNILVQIIEDDSRLKENAQSVRSIVTPDTLHIKMVWPNVAEGPKGGPYGMGVYIGNGEVGNSKARIYPVVQRHTCTNSIVVRKDAGFEAVHMGNMSSKRVLFKSTMLDVFESSAEIVNRMIAAEEENLPSFSDVLTGLSKQYGWTDKEKMTVAAGTEGDTTRAALVNGVTFAAHSLYSDNADAMLEWEMMGGDLLVAPDSVFSRARRLAEVENE